MADLLAPASVEPLLTGRFGRPYLYEDICDSTQRLLARAADRLPEGTVAACDEQRAGRGRLGRSWEAPRGTSVLCSILLRPPAGRRLAELSLVGGLAAAAAVESVTGLAAQVKWPNDVMLHGRKVAGVLAETFSSAAPPGHASRDGGVVVLGVGINVNQRDEELPAGVQMLPASLFTIDGVRRDRAPLLAALVAALERDYGLWRERGLSALEGELRARDFLRGRHVFVAGERGVAAGVDSAGRLQVELAGGRRVVESGEVTVER